MVHEDAREEEEIQNDKVVIQEDHNLAYAALQEELTKTQAEPVEVKSDLVDMDNSLDFANEAIGNADNLVCFCSMD